jgi:hypothetical protein
MEISIRVLSHVVVDYYIDSFDIDTSSKDISSNDDTSLEVLELLVSLNSKIIELES